MSTSSSSSSESDAEVDGGGRDVDSGGGGVAGEEKKVDSGGGRMVGEERKEEVNIWVEVEYREVKSREAEVENKKGKGGGKPPKWGPSKREIERVMFKKKRKKAGWARRLRKMKQ